jgi:hypothetical protein
MANIYWGAMYFQGFPKNIKTPIVTRRQQLLLSPNLHPSPFSTFCTFKPAYSLLTSKKRKMSSGRLVGKHGLMPYTLDATTVPGCFWICLPELGVLEHHDMMA